MLPIVPGVVCFIGGPVTVGVKMCCTIDPWPGIDMGSTKWFRTGARCAVGDARERRATGYSPWLGEDERWREG